MAKKLAISQKIFDVTGLSLEAYCSKFLFCNNKAFENRLRRKRLYPNEVIFLCWHLNTPAVELFGEDFLSNMMNQGQPGITQVSEEVLKMYKGNPELVNLLGSGITLVSVIRENGGIKKPALKEEEPAPEPSADDGLFSDLPLSR